MLLQTFQVKLVSMVRSLPCSLKAQWPSHSHFPTLKTSPQSCLSSLSSSPSSSLFSLSPPSVPFSFSSTLSLLPQISPTPTQPASEPSPSADFIGYGASPRRFGEVKPPTLSPISEVENVAVLNPVVEEVDDLGREQSQPPILSPISEIVGKVADPDPVVEEIDDGGSRCNVYEGRWERDEEGRYPLYAPGSCPHVDDAFTCRENGRPDGDYLKWRWRPNDCELPR